MANKYLSNNSGQIAEVEATVTSAGVADAGKIIALGASGTIDPTILPTGVGAETLALPASENLSSGNLVNVWNDSGTIKVRKADCSNGRRATGFVLAGVSSGATATVYCEGAITGLSTLTIGPYYLSTGGGVSTTAPSTSGYISQEIGSAMNTTTISFEPQQPITLA